MPLDAPYTSTWRESGFFLIRAIERTSFLPERDPSCANVRFSSLHCDFTVRPPYLHSVLSAFWRREVPACETLCLSLSLSLFCVDDNNHNDTRDEMVGRRLPKKVSITRADLRRTESIVVRDEVGTDVSRTKSASGHGRHTRR